jgi:hypothetical protein
MLRYSGEVEAADELESAMPAHTLEWRDQLLDGMDVDVSDPATFLSAASRIEQLYHQAKDRDAVVNWERVDAAAPTAQDPAEADLEMQWVRDRFTETYLADWSRNSLHLEYRYLHGEHPAPCKPSRMTERYVDRADLAAAIADLATDRAISIVGDADVHVVTAGRMIREGRRASAAAIFESLSALNPFDSKALNNWGFCIAPDDPARALELFERSAQLGFRDRPIGVGNRMFVLARLGRSLSALALAEKWWHSKAASMKDGVATMWKVGQEPPVLEKYAEAREYVALLAADLAERAGDAELASEWAQRSRCLPEKSG